MRVTQDPDGNTPSTLVAPKKKASRAEYARKRRAQCGEMRRVLNQIKLLVLELEGLK